MKQSHKPNWEIASVAPLPRDDMQRTIFTRGASLDSTETYLPRITAILRQILRDTPCQVYLFGSRAAGRDTAVSDFDVAVWSQSDLGYTLSLVREQLADSNIPFKVDVVELRTTSPGFSQRVRKEGVLLWQN